MVEDDYAEEFQESFQFFKNIKVSNKTGENVKNVFQKLLYQIFSYSKVIKGEAMIYKYMVDSIKTLFNGG